LLAASDSLLILVDIQEKFRPAITGMEDLVRRAEILTRSAIRLGIPVLVSEQYPKALGPTVPELRRWLPENQVYFPKMCFSSLGCDPLRQALTDAGRRQVVLAGIEAHVCVMQTGLDLIGAGFRVYVAVDAVSSRKAADRESALRRLERRGAALVTTEMAVIEWLGKATTTEFKEI